MRLMLTIMMIMELNFMTRMIRATLSLNHSIQVMESVKSVSILAALRQKLLNEAALTGSRRCKPLTGGRQVVL